MRPPNNVILHTVTKVAVVIILTFAIYLFMAGHNAPGGGFVGGLLVTSGIVLTYLAFGTRLINMNLPFDFKKVAAIGVILAVLTGTASLFVGVPFLTQTVFDITLPIFGEVELATAVIFDTGVALAVIGTAVNIILSISEDREEWKQ